MDSQLTINVGRAAFAVAGISTADANESAIILATGGASLLIGGGIYLATRNRKADPLRLPVDKNNGLNIQNRTLVDDGR
jgi:hypothetical protein